MLSIGSTRRATFRSSSLRSRSRRCWLVTYFPSRPANGDVLMLNTIWIVGSSTVTRGSARRSFGSLTVSPIVTSSRPTRATMSPAVASSTGTRPSLSKTWTSATLHERSTSRRPASARSAARADRAGVDAADGDAADVVGPVESGDQHLQRRVRVDLRAGDRFEHHVQAAAASSRRGVSGSCVA